MTRVIDRQKAIELRKQGKTYMGIKRALGIPKSTLSGWLSKYPLSGKQLKLLKKTIKNNKEIAIERCIITKRKKYRERIKKIYEIEKNNLLPLTERELYLAGLFLYWGEGTKNIKYPIILSNSDPKVIKFYLNWLIKSLNISKGKIKVYIQLYSDMKIRESLLFWSRELDLPLNQLSKPYIKESKRVNIDQKGFGHGTCAIGLNSIRIKEKIILGIEAIADYYNKKI